MNWAEEVDQLIRNYTRAQIKEAKIAPVEYLMQEGPSWTSPSQEGQAVERLFVLNARQWHLEDLCCASQSHDTEYADNKKRIEQCFKLKRPQLIRALNRALDQKVRRVNASPRPWITRVVLRWKERSQTLVHRLQELTKQRQRLNSDRRSIREGLKKVVFFNSMHNGDLHLSREFVKHLTRLIPAETYEYAHFNSPKTLKDLPDVNFVSLYQLLQIIPVEIRHCQPMVHVPYIYVSETRTLYLNTWVGQRHFQYLKRGPEGTNEVTLESNFKMYSDLLRLLEFPNLLSPDYRTYIPTIDYHAYEIGETDRYFSENSQNQKLRVFIANADVRSRQIRNFDFSPIILELAGRFQNAQFFLTSKAPFSSMPSRPSNILFTEDIIRASGSDLNENSYLSRFCHIIVGRESGPFEYCKVKQNLDDPHKTFICFTKNRHGANWYTGSVHARRVWSQATEADDVTQIIAAEMDRVQPAAAAR